MNIAFVSQPLDRVTPPIMNSIGIWTYEVARRLSKSHNVIVYTRGGLVTHGNISENVRTHYTRTMPYRWWSQLTNNVERRNKKARQPFFSSYMYNLEYSLQIALDVRRQNIDVVHIQNFSQFVPIIRALNPHVKIALHMRCEWLTQLDHAMIGRRLNDTDLIFGISDYITNKIRRAFPEHSDKCFTIANGVDMEKFTPSLTSPQVTTLPVVTMSPQAPSSGTPLRTILMVGRISPEKGVHVLMEAFSKVAYRFPDTRLVLVGSIVAANKKTIVEISDDAMVNALGVFYEGNYRTKLNALIPEDLKDRVHFEGNVGYYKTIDFYQNSIILVNPSISESFGRSLIEGNACELPVIAARAGGMTEIIEPGYNGLLVEPGNVQQLADAMNTLLEDEPFRRQMGINGRKRVFERYTWAKICSDLIAAYCAPV